jgi:hypothetical protein
MDGIWRINGYLRETIDDLWLILTKSSLIEKMPSTIAPAARCQNESLADENYLLMQTHVNMREINYLLKIMK